MRFWGGLKQKRNNRMYFEKRNKKEKKGRSSTERIKRENEGENKGENKEKKNWKKDEIRIENGHIRVHHHLFSQSDPVENDKLISRYITKENGEKTLCFLLLIRRVFCLSFALHLPCSFQELER